MSKGLVLVLFLIVKEKRDTHGGREGGREGQTERLGIIMTDWLF